MSKKSRLGLLLGLWLSVQAGASTVLELSAADLERLGVVLELPRAVTQVEVASGIGQIVIPPAQQAIVSTTVGGALARILVAEGDYVTAGQPLAEIASAELLSLQREYVDAAASSELAEAQLARDEGLLADGIIAERRLHESRMAERVARARLDQIRQQLRLAGMTQPELARLVDTRELSPMLQLRAPIDGVVVEQLSQLGGHVDALDPVYRVADLSRLWLQIRVPQEQAANVAPKMQVVAAAAGGAVDGEVRLVSSVVDESSQTVLVRASVENARMTLRVGQFLPARVFDAPRDGRPVVAVPSSAIVRVDGLAYVFCHDGGRVAAAAVEILAEDGLLTYLSAGLDAGREVAVAGVAALKSVWISAQDGGE
jgi:cobalt-zinc-cadmium efflux system membrane fusion protein